MPSLTKGEVLIKSKVTHIILFVFLVGLGCSSTALAATVNLSEFESDPDGFGLQKEDMLATLSFDITGGGTELTLTVDNRTDETASGQTADMNRVYFSSTSDVTGLTYLSATHSVEGDVLSGWAFNALTNKGGSVPLTAGTGEGNKTHGNGFGVHDFSLVGGVGNDPDMIGPGESIAFVFTISGTGPFDMNDFIALSEQTTGGTNTLTVAAAKFVKGSFGGDYDSGFGGTASVDSTHPEPSSFLLAALALVGLLAHGRHRRRA